MAQHVLTERHNGSTVRVRVGDVIKTRLSDNAVAGYRWQISSIDSSHLVVLGQDHEAARGGVGSAGTAIISLNARQPGRTHVEIVSSRSLSSEHPVTDHFAVDLDIVE